MNNNNYTTKIIIKKYTLDLTTFLNKIITNTIFFIIDYKFYNYYQSILDKFLSTHNYIFINKSEYNKNYFFTFKILNKLITNSYTKDLIIISIGGGVTGDISGFISSIFLRGVPLIHIPTTLVSQVDSSIGGKNGVNTPQGKNIIGTINQAKYIIIAIELLLTLPSYNYLMGFS